MAGGRGYGQHSWIIKDSEQTRPVYSSFENVHKISLIFPRSWSSNDQVLSLLQSMPPTRLLLAPFLARYKTLDFVRNPRIHNPTRSSTNSSNILASNKMVDWSRTREICEKMPPFTNDYKPIGETSKIDDLTLYTVGSGPKVIIFVYDAFGMTNSTKQTCDAIAKQGNTVINVLGIVPHLTVF